MLKFVYEFILYALVYIAIYSVVLYFAVRGWRFVLCRSKSKKKKKKREGKEEKRKKKYEE